MTTTDYADMVCTNGLHVGGCACRAGGDAEIRPTVPLESFYVGQPLTFAALAVCDLCGEAEARLVVDDASGSRQAICDDCWQRVIEDREAEDDD